MNILSLAWWCAYTACGLLVQQQVPGVDALAPGFLLALQERRPLQIFWLFILFCLIQEGAGSLSFGAGLLWYAGQILLFRLGARFFMSENLVFVMLQAACLGVFHLVLIWFMSVLQNTSVDFAQLVRESFWQALLIPLLWSVAYLLRPKRLRHAR